MAHGQGEAVGRSGVDGWGVGAYGGAKWCEGVDLGAPRGPGGGGSAREAGTVFFGEYEHSLDAKGRIILPAKFRDRLEGGGFITKVLDGCLAVYPADEFDKVANDMMEKAR